MEKFGVEEEESPKTASPVRVCPACGAALRSSDRVNVLLCPNCGSKPFEPTESK